MPSRLITEESILISALLMVRSGGKTFIPMLMALERFISRISIFLFAESCFFKKKQKNTEIILKHRGRAKKR